MQQWAYAIVFYDREAKVWMCNGDDIVPGKHMIEALNAMGRRGWEMCGNEPFQNWTVGGQHFTSTASFYFRREIPALPTVDHPGTG